jgi:putative membrane protein insertion efficiency factor
MNPISLIIEALIRFYQLFVSPVLPGACRHAPTCSEYCLEAVRRHGPVAGSWLALKRIGRCQPWGSSGYDPVPTATCGDHHATAPGAPAAPSARQGGA